MGLHPFATEGPSFLEAGIQTGAYVEGIQKSRGIDLAVSKLNFGGGSGLRIDGQQQC